MNEPENNRMFWTPHALVFARQQAAKRGSHVAVELGSTDQQSAIAYGCVLSKRFFSGNAEH